MRPNYKPKLTNRPKHLKQDDSYYFITCRTVDGNWFLRPESYKQILLDKIHQKTDKFATPLIAYAILHNHYHLMLKIAAAAIIPKFIRELNGSSARAINEADSSIDRKIWWNYYDHIIRNEEDFFKHLNYIHQNPIKHQVSKTFSYQFSSYDGWLKKKGKVYLDHAYEKYPVVDFADDL